MFLHCLPVCIRGKFRNISQEKASPPGAALSVVETVARNLCIAATKASSTRLLTLSTFCGGEALIVVLRIFANV